MPWFTRKTEAKVAVEVTAPRPPSLWRRMGVPRLFERGEKPAGTQPPSVAVPEAAPAEPAVFAPLPAGKSAWKRFTDSLAASAESIDNAIALIAVPFGVLVRHRGKRYAILLGVFAFLFLVGALPIPYVPLFALAFGYVGVLAISRAWVANEQKRVLIVKKLKDGDPDMLPDLRRTALVSALMLFILFPLTFMQAHQQFGLFAVSPETNFLDWVWFSLDKTYLKALPDWSILYGVHISSIDFQSSWGRHLVFVSRLTFDYILLQGIFRLMAIKKTIREAVAVVKTDPDVAVRVGKRAIPALVDKLSDPDRSVRGAAANAITQLGDPEGMKQMHEALAQDAAPTA